MIKATQLGGRGALADASAKNAIFFQCFLTERPFHTFLLCFTASLLILTSNDWLCSDACKCLTPHNYFMLMKSIIYFINRYLSNVMCTLNAIGNHEKLCKYITYILFSRVDFFLLPSFYLAGYTYSTKFAIFFFYIIVNQYY